MEARDEDQDWRDRRDFAAEKYGTADDIARTFGPPPTGTESEQRGAPAGDTPGTRQAGTDA